MKCFLIGLTPHQLISAAGGAIWSVGRIAYAWGYQSGEPSKRARGAFMHIGTLMLLGSTISLAYNLIRA